MTKYFGTDGIRAEAGHFPLDHNSIYSLAKALIDLLLEKNMDPKVLIGRDTRESGEWIERSLFQGMKDAGGSAVSAGIIPTSAVAILTKKHSFSSGIVISASHNPFLDNGIKIFSSEGMKISTDWEEILEEAISKKASSSPQTASIRPDAHLSRDYEDFLKSRLDSVPPPPLKVVLDCSNGAGSFLAPEVFSELGFKVITLGSSPDGRNINKGCGSLHPEKLAEKVLNAGADIGIAYDGDADRALWVDETGRILNGDHTLYVLSRYMQETGRLRSETIVATTMSNLGLEMALGKMGLRLHRAPVGDRFVLEQMLKIGSNLGGEQSGHTILLDDCPTGDGILTSLRMIEVMAVKGVPLSELVSGFKEHPQILKNVTVTKKENLDLFPEIREAMKIVEDELKDSGRLNVRFSGTEPLARIMIEGRDQSHIEDLAEGLAEVIAKNLGGDS